MQYVLRYSENQIEKSVRLPNHAILIGRSSSCDLTLIDTAISRRHCRLTPLKDTVIVEDLESANGTFVNGSRIRHKELKAGARLILGAFTINLMTKPASGYYCHSLDCPNHTGRLFRPKDSRRAVQNYLQILVFDEASGEYYCESCYLDFSAGRTPSSGQEPQTVEVSSLLG